MPVSLRNRGILKYQHVAANKIVCQAHIKWSILYKEADPLVNKGLISCLNRNRTLLIGS